MLQLSVHFFLSLLISTFHLHYNFTVTLVLVQTLMVMDSIWQEKSLDLNLVPYGCIATGHNIGETKAEFCSQVLLLIKALRTMQKQL